MILIFVDDIASRVSCMSLIALVTCPEAEQDVLIVNPTLRRLYHHRASANLHHTLERRPPDSDHSLKLLGR